MMLVGLLTALPSWAQKESGLSMKFSNEDLPSVLLRLEKASDYKFLFTYDDVRKYKVNGSVTNARFFEVLDYVLRVTPLVYKVDGKIVNIVVGQQAKPVSMDRVQTFVGYVYEASTKQPVIGAQISVDGRDEKVVTNIEGKFTINLKNASGKERISVSYLGMKTIVVPLQMNQKIYMETDTKNIAEVVVTGIFKKA